MAEDRIKELEAELANAKAEIEDLKSNQDDAKSEVSFATDLDTEYDGNTSDGSVYRSGSKSKAKQKKKHRLNQTETLKNLLSKHQHLLKEIGNITLENTTMEKTKSLLNSLTKTQVNQAVKTHKNGSLQDSLAPPDIEKNLAAESSKHRDAVSTLRDMFKHQFSGKAEEDLESLLFAAGKLSEEAKLSKEQFFNLIKSRTQMGSNLYVELRFHEENNSSLKQTYAELIPVFGRQSSYIQCLNRLNYYKPSANAAPNTIFADLKKLSTELATSAKPANPSNFIYNRIKDKLLVLHPLMATTLVEREQTEGSFSTASLSRIYIQLAPVYSKKTKESTVFEVHEDDVTSIEEIPVTVHVIKLSETIVNRLRNKCYKCAGDDHYGRDCPLYKDCQMAYYLCSTCKLAVHLPKDCKSPKVDKDKVNIVTEENVKIVLDTKNDLWG